MIKKILKYLFSVSIISLISIVLFQLYRVNQMKKFQMVIHERIDTYLSQRVLPNSIDYPNELGKAIQSIDAALTCIMEFNKDHDAFTTHGQDIPNLCLMIYQHEGSKLGNRITNLYNSDKETYSFLNVQFPLAKKYWYNDYFMFKSTAEVLLELSVLKHQLIIAYNGSVDGTTRANSG